MWIYQVWEMSSSIAENVKKKKKKEMTPFFSELLIINAYKSDTIKRMLLELRCRYFCYTCRWQSESNAWFKNMCGL